MPEDKTVDMKIDTGANGAVYFASDVIQTIAGIALTEVEGIANMVRYQGLAADRRKNKNANNIKNDQKKSSDRWSGFKNFANNLLTNISFTNIPFEMIQNAKNNDIGNHKPITNSNKKLDNKEKS